jgi:protein-disulfide isomerase
MSKREEIRERHRRDRQQTLLTGILVVVGIAVIITAAVIFRTQASIGDIVVPDFHAYPESADNAIGDPDAPVRIEEFSDFQCPACRQFHDLTLGQIVETYVNTGQVYFVYRNYPFLDSQSPGNESQDAAMAGLCAAEQGRFWDFHDIIFANQIGENVGSFTRPRLTAMAEKLGLDPSFEDCLREGRYLEQIRADVTAAAEAGVRSTPSFLINGKLVVGAQPFSAMASLIEEAIAQPQGTTP